MEVKRVKAVCFSPTKTTERVLNQILGTVDIPATMLDFTPFQKTYDEVSFAPDELLLIGIPVYGGRVPSVFTERVSYLKGANSPAILIATYGNRAYEDALIELKTLVSAQGFVPVAAAAVVAEHSSCPELAAGRPNEQDLQDIGMFSRQVMQKLVQIGDLPGCDLPVKGNIPYREYKVMPMQPHSTKDCMLCGTCAKLCPAGAIPPENPDQTDDAKCICCLSCIKNCPVKARKQHEQQVLGVKAHLMQYIEPKEYEYFTLP